MGGLLGRNRAPAADPFYNPVPPPAAIRSAVGPGLGPGPIPGGGLATYGAAEEYGYEYEPTSQLINYGTPVKQRIDPYGGRYAQGLNQIPGVSPWNYGNFYLGNTTMQMMPMMLNKVHQFGQMQAISALGNAGLLGSTPGLTNLPMMPCCAPPSFSLPMGPCCPLPSFNMPMAAPMMAAASPLPVAFNPLVQGMYPMASMNPVSWMTPASFISALSSGPMPYRPPTFDFPNNIGMVMTLPYGTPNPFFSAPSFGSFNSSFNFGNNGSSCFSFSYSIPPATAAPAPPPVSYYPQPVPVPQPYPVPYYAPVAAPSIQQVPVPQPGSIGASLCPSHGVVSNSGFSLPAVMSSHHTSTTHTPFNNQLTKPPLPVYNPIDQSQLLMGQHITTNIGSNNVGVTHSAAKNATLISQTHDTLSDRIRRHIPSIVPRFSRSNYNFGRSQPPSEPTIPPILRGQLISDSGWLPKTSPPQTITSIFSGKKRKRLLYTSDIGRAMPIVNINRSPFTPNRRRRHSTSSTTSEYDCAICQQQRDQRRLREHYGSSTVSSLLSSPKGSRKHNFSSNESNFSSLPRTPNSFKPSGYQSHRRHPTRIKIKHQSPSPRKSPSPVLLRQSPIQDSRPNATIHEEEEEVEPTKQEQIQVHVPIKKQSPDEDESITSEQSESKKSSKFSNE